MTPPFHVVHVIDSLARSGGSERQLLVNLSHFSNPQLRHSLVVLRPGADSRLDEVPAHIPTVVVQRNDDRPSRLSTAWELMKHLRADRPDLIHCALPNASYACRLVGPLLRIPVVESLVNISHEPIRAVDNPNVSVRKLKAHSLFDRLTMRHFVGYHAVGPTVADSWHRTVGLPMEKMAIIPRGVPPDLLASDSTEKDRSALAEFGLSEDAFVLLSVGRHEPQKGHRYLIEAMPQILAEVPQAVLLIAGREGALTPLLKSLVGELGLGDRVHLLGSRSDVPALLRAADVFVFPSLYEGNGGNAMIEAMAAGCPVVVTNSPPMTEIASDPRLAVLVPISDPASLAGAINDLSRSPESLTEFGRAARSRIAELPDPNAVAGRLEDWYERLLRQRVPPVTVRSLPFVKRRRQTNPQQKTTEGTQ